MVTVPSYFVIFYLFLYRNGLYLCKYLEMDSYISKITLRGLLSTKDQLKT